MVNELTTGTGELAVELDLYYRMFKAPRMPMMTGIIHRPENGTVGGTVLNIQQSPIPKRNALLMLGNQNPGVTDAFKLINDPSIWSASLDEMDPEIIFEVNKDLRDQVGVILLNVDSKGVGISYLQEISKATGEQLLTPIVAISPPAYLSEILPYDKVHPDCPTPIAKLHHQRNINAWLDSSKATPESIVQAAREAVETCQKLVDPPPKKSETPLREIKLTPWARALECLLKLRY